MSDMTLEDMRDRGREILDDIKWLRWQQCQRCGLAYRNVRGTHDRRFGGLLISRCEYEPVGHEVSDV